MHHLSRLAILFFLNLILIPGCANSPLSDPNLPLITDTAIPDDQTYTAQNLWPITPAKRVYTYASEKHEQTGSHNLAHQSQNRYRLTLENLRELIIQKQNDGSLAIVSETNQSQNVILRYDPPLLLIPARMTGSNPVEAHSRVVVHNLKTDAVRDRGTVKTSTKLIAHNTNTVHVHQERHLDLRLAKVDVDIRTVYHTRKGPIREYVEEQTKPLGLFKIKRQHRLTIR